MKDLLEQDAIAQGIPSVNLGSDHISREEYVRYIRTYLMLIISRVAYYGSTLNGWLPKDNALGPAMPRQTIPMSWDYAEANPFRKSSGGISACANVIAKALSACAPNASYNVFCKAAQSVAQDCEEQQKYIISTDPPYYDNIAYADLSDYFYQWLRLGLRYQYPELFKTLSSPKTAELVATPYRHHGKDNAEEFFLSGMKKVFAGLSSMSLHEFPITIYYSFKQSESDADGGSRRTGWETFLTAVLDSGLEITATWPLRAERKGRMLAAGTNALASCILLVCRTREPHAATCTRSDFRRAARCLLKEHLEISERLSIPPVDYAQVAVGVGISVFSSYRAVLSTDDSPVDVGMAIADIQSLLDDILSGDEGSYDKDTQFVVCFYESYGYAERPYGDAELLAKAKNISVDGVIKSGTLGSVSGSVFLIRRDQLDDDWNPFHDKRLCIWEATQYLIKRLETGEQAAGTLLAQLKDIPGHGDLPANCRALAYRLYNHCEKTKQSEEARAYNGLVIAWPELEKLAAVAASPVQPSLL
jgi:putative DNA methylase